MFPALVLFVFLLLKWSFGNQQLLFSIYEDLAVISIYLFIFHGGESRVQLQLGVHQTEFCRMIMHEADPHLGSDTSFMGLLLSPSLWKAASLVPPRVVVCSRRD